MNTEIHSKVQKYIISKLAKLVKEPRTLADLDHNFMDLGLESIQFVQIAQEIEKEAKIELFPTVFFEYPNTAELAVHFSTEHAEAFALLLGARDPEVVTIPKSVVSNPVASNFAVKIEPVSTSNDIAIIGMSGQFAGSETLDQFWKHLAAKKDLIQEIPQDHWDYTEWYDPNPDAKDKTYCKWGSFINDVDAFDADFFKISRREAEWIDPQLRLLLQCFYATGEDAGIVNRLRGTNTGVFVGVCSHDYVDRLTDLHLPMNPFTGVGTTQTVFANRASFLFNLTGPSIAYDTACSSTLVALHAACQALRSSECAMAFVGGVNLLLSSQHYRYFSSIKALSATGHCYSFDEKADGYVPGECVASIMLKPLEQAKLDGNKIYAVIKGSASLHGGYTPSLTAPSTAGEENVIVKAWQNAQINPETLSYIEAHGTGTKLGDPIEINALKNAFKRFTNKQQFCAIGSCKANIGHTEGAAGLAGLIKVVLQMKNRTIPAMPNFSALNSYIKLDDSALFINRENQEWKSPDNQPRRAAVSSFGFSGSYAHVVLEEYNEVRSAKIAMPQLPVAILLSAKSAAQLDEQKALLVACIKEKGFSNNDLPDIAYTLAMGREAMEERFAVVVSSIEDLVGVLLSSDAVDVYRGRVDKENLALKLFADDEDLQETVGKWLQRRKFEKLLDLWVKGLKIDWSVLFEPQQQYTIMNLPTYPFAKQRIWLPQGDVVAVKKPPIASVPIASNPITLAPLVLTKPLSVPVEVKQPVFLTAPIQADALHDELSSSLADALFTNKSDIGVDVLFNDLGLDSIISTEWIQAINKKYGTTYTSDTLYEYPTIRKLSNLLSNLPVEGEAVVEKKKPEQVEPEQIAMPPSSGDIAIIGLSGRYPQAETVVEFWENLLQAKDCITAPPEGRNIRFSDVKGGGFLSDIDRFDPLFFNISPREAELMDPNERLFLETSWNLLESAGYTRSRLQKRYSGSVGVFVGAMYQQYQCLESDDAKEALISISSQGGIANRVSHFFDFHGPSIAVDTMCSSSANAVHLACMSLQKGECSMAISGGINLTCHPKKYLGLRLAKMLGSDLERRSFAQSDGFIPSEAVGAVLLKPLQDAIADKDDILAVIKSTAISHRGASKEGFGVPNAASQVQLMRRNFEKSGIDPSTIGYVESAATGNSLGDHIEVQALTEVFGEGKQFCSIGSVKSNIGHAEAASGITQLTKVVLQLQHQLLVPSIKSEPLHSKIDFAKTAFALQTVTQAWEKDDNFPRRAVVHSFGAGGSLVHMILEEYQPQAAENTIQKIDQEKDQDPYVFIFSAKNEERLKAYITKMREFISRHEDIRLDNLAYTLAVCREHMQSRLALIAKTRQELLDHMQALVGKKHEMSIYGKKGRTELHALAKSWCEGQVIAWDDRFDSSARVIHTLPTYPFEGRSLWVQNRSSQSTDEKKDALEVISSQIGMTVEELKLDTPFWEYGVDSIISMQLFGQLQVKVDSTLTLEKVSGCKTARELLNVLSKEAATSAVQTWPQFPELIRLNTISTGRPVFWFHAGLGGVETYAELAQRCKRPFFGIQARGFMTDRAPLHGVQAMASYYVHIVNSVQPKGPYDFGGYSFGGALAYEVCRQLQELGEEVRTIVMCDTHDGEHMKKVNTVYKSELLQTINTMLAGMVAKEPEKLFEMMIHRDELDAASDDEAFLAQAVALANKRGLNKTVSQLQLMTKQNAIVQKAYDIHRFFALPLLHPNQVSCYYFRNKSGNFWGPLEPYNIFNASETDLEHATYWGEWKKIFTNFQIMDVDSFSHMTLLTQPIPKEVILEFCEGLYAKDP